MIANIVIQSTDNTGKCKGNFLRDSITGLQITPTFNDLCDLFDYMNDHFPDRISINMRQYKLITIIK